MAVGSSGDGSVFPSWLASQSLGDDGPPLMSPENESEALVAVDLYDGERERGWGNLCAGRMLANSSSSE